MTSTVKILLQRGSAKFAKNASARVGANASKSSRSQKIQRIIGPNPNFRLTRLVLQVTFLSMFNQAADLAGRCSAIAANLRIETLNAATKLYLVLT